MKIYTRKKEVGDIVYACLQMYEGDPKSLADELYKHLLTAKVKFPLLEYCGEMIYDQAPRELHLEICNQISSFKTIGGDVIIGILLRKHLQGNLDLIFDEAAKFIMTSDTWHATDNIGERVFGWALLNQFDAAFTSLKRMAKSENNWVVRSIGPGCHNAIKNGLSQPKTEKLFELLLSLSNAKDYHIKTGIGWAAKTVAKFHPEIVKKYDLDKEGIGQWFRTKVRIGLDRNSYAKRN